MSISWAGISVYTFWGALAPNRILPVAKFTLHLSLAFAYIGSVTTAQLSSSGRQQNFAALSSERHLRSAGWPSRWALAHISSLSYARAKLLSVSLQGFSAECTNGR